MPFLLVFGLATGTVVATAAPAMATGTNDYPWATKVKDSGLSPLGFYYRECTDYAAWEINEQMGGNINKLKFKWADIESGGSGNAVNWKQGAINNNHTVNGTPATGAVAWWGTGDWTGDTAGHVAIVKQVDYNTDGSVKDIVVADYNGDNNGNYGSHTIHKTGSPGYLVWPDDFLHIADVAGGSTGGGTSFAFNSFTWPDMAYLGTDTLYDGQGLYANQYIMSQNGEYALELTGNGELAEFGGWSSGKLWSNGVTSGSLTYNMGGLSMQNDGNLVLYNSNGSVLWSKPGSSGDDLVVQNDGNVVLRSSSGVALWASNTPNTTFTASNTWTDTLTAGQSLASCAMLTSSDGRFHLLVECTGDLYEYGPGNSPMWHSITNGNSGAVLTLQSGDGNMVLYSTGGAPLWQTATGGNTGDALALQDDGNVVLYSSSGVALWANGQ